MKRIHFASLQQLSLPICSFQFVVGQKKDGYADALLEWTSCHVFIDPGLSVFQMSSYPPRFPCRCRLLLSSLNQDVHFLPVSNHSLHLIHLASLVCSLSSCSLPGVSILHAGCSNSLHVDLTSFITFDLTTFLMSSLYFFERLLSKSEQHWAHLYVH